MIGKDFLYNGKHLSEFGFIMVAPEETDSFGLTREAVKGTVSSDKTIVPHFGTKYTDVIVLNFFIIKNICSPDNSIVTYQELRAVQSWLTSPKTPKQLIMEPAKYESVEYYGLFTDVTSYEVYGLNGLKLVFTCNSPYAFENRMFSITSTNSISYSFVCDTDELEEAVYPSIAISPASTGSFSIKNDREDKTMSFSLTKVYTTLVIDCKTKRIIGDNAPLSLFDIGWNAVETVDTNNVNTGVYELYWLRFWAGENQLEFKGNGKFDISYKVPIKVGGYANG